MFSGRWECPLPWPVIRIETRYRKGHRPLGEAFPADGFLVSPAGFEFLEVARLGNPQLAVD